MDSIRFLSAALAPLAFAGVCMTPLAAQDSAEPETEVKTEAEVEAEGDAAEPTKGEQRLAKLLEGRVAGEPMRCIRVGRSEPMQTIDRTAYVYGSGKTIYVQPTSAPNQIDSSDVLVSRRVGASQLCRLDIFTTVDPVSRMQTGSVFFEDFIPYTRVKADAPPAEGESD